MTELTLRGVHDDEEHLVLIDPAGTEYLLPIDESLYAAVRRDRSRLSQLRAQEEPVRPRDIQAMVRSGMSAQEIAEATGASLDHIRTYEGPVLAERNHIAQQAGRTLVYPENDQSGAPSELLRLCRERLRMRDVDLDTMRWDAWKTAAGSWYVELRFIAADKDRAAGWEYARGSIRPLDDEARWLSDSGPSDSGPIPNFGTAAERVYNIEVDEARAQSAAEPNRSSHQTETGRILESLRRRRGRHLAAGDDDAVSPAGVGAVDLPRQHTGLRAVPEAQVEHPDGAHTALSAPQDAVDTGVFALPSQDTAPDSQQDTSTEAAPVDPDQPSLLDEPGVLDEQSGLGSTDTQPLSRSVDAEQKRRGRSSVPSWDEIMFGSKRD